MDGVLRPHIDLTALSVVFRDRAALVGTANPPCLFGWNDLNEVLAGQRLKEPRLRVVGAPDGNAVVQLHQGRRGVEIPRLRLAELNAALQGGGTLVVDAVDETHAGLRDLTRGFARTFGSVPQTNLYASFGAKPGFGMHWDDHDVFVFQLAGRKHWKIHEPTRASPAYRDVEAPSEPTEESFPYFDQVIEAGQLLYVPRGHWHDVVGIDEASLHLTVGITHPTPSDAINWLADELRALDAFRADIPLFDTAARASLEQQLRIAVNERLEGVFEAYLRYRRAHLTYRSEPSLPATVSRRLTLSSKIMWIALTAPRREADGSVSIQSQSRSMSLAPDTWGLIEMVWRGQGVTASELASDHGHHLSASQVATVLLALADLGAVTIRE